LGANHLHYAEGPVVDAAYNVGCDSLDGGLGDDLLVGDGFTELSPSLFVPCNLLEPFEELLDTCQAAGSIFSAALAEQDHVFCETKAELVTRSDGRHAYQQLVWHCDSLTLGRDSLAGGPGQDRLIGGWRSLVSPELTVTPRDGFPAVEVPSKLKWHDACNGPSRPSSIWIVGGDTLISDSDDLVTLGSWILKSFTISRGEGLGSHDYAKAHHDAERIAEALISSAWF